MDQLFYLVWESFCHNALVFNRPYDNAHKIFIVLCLLTLNYFSLPISNVYRPLVLMVINTKDPQNYRSTTIWMHKYKVCAQTNPSQ
jgi:hypothetical protein